jgi:hypothetical protein
LAGTLGALIQDTDLLVSGTAPRRAVFVIGLAVIWRTPPVPLHSGPKPP